LRRLLSFGLVALALAAATASASAQSFVGREAGGTMRAASALAERIRAYHRGPGRWMGYTPVPPGYCGTMREGEAVLKELSRLGRRSPRAARCCSNVCVEVRRVRPPACGRPILRFRHEVRGYRRQRLIGANLMPRLPCCSQLGPMDSMICQMSQTARQSRPTDTPKQPNTPNDARCQSLSTSMASLFAPGCHATHHVAIPMSTRMTMHTTMRAIIHSRAKPTVSFLTSVSPRIVLAAL